MTVVTLHAGVPVLLVDASYYIFHRYFATLRWYSFQPSYDKDAVGMGDAVFVDAYLRHFEADVKKWRKGFALGAKGAILMCADCSRAEIFRHTIMEGYKEGRVTPAGFDGGIFERVYAYLAEHGERLGVVVLGEAGCEADDIAAMMHGAVRAAEGGANHPVVILTNDNDYLQLADGNTQIVNMQGKDLTTRGCGDAKKDLLRKMLLGDKSDGIPPVMARLGAKRVAELVEKDDEGLETALRGLGDGVWELFKRNRALIDFAYIPGELRERFMGKIEIDIRTRCDLY